MPLKIKKGKKIAFKKIICYKQINVYTDDNGNIKYVTPYRKFHVTIGNKYKTKLGCRLFRVYEGFHSFKYDYDCMTNKKRLQYPTIYLDDNGIKYPAKPLLVKCVIPFGSWYYEGIFNKRYECLVSNKIKIVEIIKEIT